MKGNLFIAGLWPMQPPWIGRVLQRSVATRCFNRNGRSYLLQKAQLAHLPPEGGAAHAESLGGLVAPPVVVFEGGAQPLALVVMRNGRCIGHPRFGVRETLHRWRGQAFQDFSGKVLAVNRLPPADRDRVFERVLQ